MNRSNKRQILFSSAIYVSILALLLLPWMKIGDESFSLFRLARTLKSTGVAAFFTRFGITSADLDALQAGVIVSLALYGFFALCSVFYFLTVLFRKKWNLNCAALVGAIALIYTGSAGSMLSEICSNRSFAFLYPFLLFVLCVVELIGRKIIEHWSETKREADAFRQAEANAREERLRRLDFPGRYSRLFRVVIWKNFKHSLRDYLMLFACNTAVFAFLIIGFGCYNLTSPQQSGAQTGTLAGAAQILLQSIVWLLVSGTVMLVLLLIYYLRKRIPQYGVFRTLGIRKTTLRLCIGAELGLGALLSILTGGAIGCAALLLLRTKTSGGSLSLFQMLPPLHLLMCLGILCLFYLAIFFVTHDLFVSFQLGTLSDLTTRKEWMPKQFTVIPFILGLVLIAVMTIRNAGTHNYEGMLQFAGCFLGLYLILRAGISITVSIWEKRQDHLLRMLKIHPFYHRSRTSCWYLFGLCAIHTCILSVFALQISTVQLVNEPKDLFPYDLVCLAYADDADDQAFIDCLQNDCGATISRYPMFRVSGTDGTKRMEDVSQLAIRSQHIGISESTYHALKKQIDPSYTPKDLGLEESDDTIYIVHQQDKSTKAQPIDYRSSRKKPYLYTGPVCEYADPFAHNTAFRKYRIAGEEFASLIGVFCNGERENLVVFSDVAFEQAKDAWKTTNKYTGELLSAGSSNYFDSLTTESAFASKDLSDLTSQGPSELILVSVDEKNLSAAEDAIKDFRKRHRPDESYDALVESCYTKSDALSSMQSQLQIKKTMGVLLALSFFAASLVLVGIKLLTEFYANKRRNDFLFCLGMPRKERRKLSYFEMNVYVLVTAFVSVTISACLILSALHARCFAPEDVRTVVTQCLLFAVGDLSLFALAVRIFTALQLYLFEKKKRM